MIRLDIDMPLGCIYEKNEKTEYCPLCNHYDVPFCQFLDDDEVEIGIDERPCYCPLSAEPEPLSQAYARAVWTWLLNYQIKSAELKGAYSPYEVLSWVTNDWRKENGLDKQTGGD